MQAKQLRALMRIDNSDLKEHRVPSQLVFRKASRQFTRMLRDRIGTDYLLCQAKELLLARRFLSKRGLDPQYAGEWSNDFVYLPKSQNEEQEMFEWKDDQNDYFHEDSESEWDDVSDFSSSPPIVEEQLLQSKADSINNLGGHNAASLQGNPSSTYRVPTIPNLYSNGMRNPTNYQTCGIVRLRIGSEQAARVRDLEQQQQQECTGQSNHYITKTDVRPFRLWNTLESDGEHARAEIPRNDKIPAAGNSELPVRRIMGGQWSYESLEPKPWSMPTSSMRYEKLEQARMEAQTKQAEANTASVAATTEHIENAIMSQPEDCHGGNSSKGIQSSSQQENGGTSSVAEMLPSSDTCIPESSINPVTPLDVNEVQTNSAFPGTDTDLESHSMSIRNISVQDSEHRLQPAPIAPPAEEGKQKLEYSLPAFVQPSESETVGNLVVDEQQDEERKSQTPAVDGHSAEEKTNGEDAGPELKEDTNVEEPLHREKTSPGQAEAQPTSLVLDHANEEEEQDTVMHVCSPSLTAPKLSDGGNTIHMEDIQLQNSMPGDECDASHSSSDSETVQEESPVPKFDSVEPNDEDSDISKTTKTKSNITLTKPKAPSKKTAAINERRRSVRLNGPPKKQTLRKRK
ncbi:hypothetical protein VTN77DRAFT_8845 [Rasamsonia byssochlamydoides]|uniref:uncharacterized protein n=1 Tax=Rasamsonia byssochlamydoides TaxID=89139 RepID=UPI00374498BB